MGTMDIHTKCNDNAANNFNPIIFGPKCWTMVQQLQHHFTWPMHTVLLNTLLDKDILKTPECRISNVSQIRETP